MIAIQRRAWPAKPGLNRQNCNVKAVGYAGTEALDTTLRQIPPIIAEFALPVDAAGLSIHSGAYEEPERPAPGSPKVGYGRPSSGRRQPNP